MINSQAIWHKIHTNIICNIQHTYTHYKIHANEHVTRHKSTKGHVQTLFAAYKTHTHRHDTYKQTWHKTHKQHRTHKNNIWNIQDSFKQTNEHNESTDNNLTNESAE